MCSGFIYKETQMIILSVCSVATSLFVALLQLILIIRVMGEYPPSTDAQVSFDDI